MSHQIPYGMPPKLRLGDLWTWKLSLPDYRPADGWVLTYYFKSRTDAIHNFSIAASASGADHLISQASSAMGFDPQTFYFEARVVSGSEVYTVSSGEVEMLPNFSTLDATYDGRTDAEHILEAHITAYRNRAASRIESGYSLSAVGRSYSYRSLPELLEAIKFWQSEVDRERQAEAVARGEIPQKDIVVRFQ